MGDDVMDVEAAAREALSGQFDSKDSGPDTADQAQQNVITSLFAAPPIQSTLYTRDNIRRCQILKQVRDDTDQGSFNWNSSDPQQRLQRQTEILNLAAIEIEAREKEKETAAVEGKEGREANVEEIARVLPVPDWDVLLTMDPPRVDWIEEDGYYTCFGDRWPVEDRLAGLQEMGMRQFYADESKDRRAAMMTILRTLLKSYLGLVDILLETPQEYLASTQIPNTDQIIQSWRFVSQDKAKDINDLSINFMHLLNEMRPLQAKEELMMLLKRQLRRRREETELIKLQCQAMRAELRKMRES
ncbi:hypothetical protein CBS101457_003673 [Exobasidium rhododendri]|nr:hypothetical protein CBS101457_003673 [Exobasidium rhododendri]